MPTEPNQNSDSQKWVMELIEWANTYEIDDVLNVCSEDVESNKKALLALEKLNLSKKGISQLPDAISKLTNLKVLDMSYSSLDVFPEKIFDLTWLESINLRWNKISFVPSSIGCLSRLIHLDISSNQLKELPKEMAYLTSLQYLNISWNHIGLVPDFILSLGELNKIDWAWNRV